MEARGQHGHEVPAITEDQALTGELLLGYCGLGDVADAAIVMHGYSTTVRDGLALCSDVLRTMPTGEVAGMIRAAVAQQGR